MKGKALGVLNDYFVRQDQLALNEIKVYCEEQGWVEDFDNIVLPLFKKYGWELIRDIGDIEWEWVIGGEYRVIYLNLDRLSTLVEWNEKKQKFIAI